MSVYSHERLSFFLQAAGKASAVDDKSKKVASKRNPLFKSRPKVFGIGGDLRPKGSRNMYRFVRWPKYIKVQRQKQVLLNRIKVGCVVFGGLLSLTRTCQVPPAINQFRHTLEKNHASELFRLLGKYKPETKQAKAKRLLAEVRGLASTDDWYVLTVAASPLLRPKPVPRGRKCRRASPMWFALV